VSDPRLEAALAIARERYRAIASDEDAAFEATLSAHADACAALQGVVATAGEADIQAMNELLAIETQILAEIARVTRETSARIGVLRTGGKTAAAYRAAP
jgi:hypothetical protein